jgi:hypothetical protein
MIAVKGMGIPKNCMECDFRKSTPFSSEVYCNKLSCNENIIIYEDERLDNCPLIEIVTCKDCEHCKKDTSEGERLLWCKKDGFATSEDYYCGGGRRESK